MGRTGNMLLRGAGVRLAANASQMVVALGLTPYVFGVLGDHHYGLWVLVASLLGFYGVLDLGVSSAVARFTSRALAQDDEQAFREYFVSAFWLLASFGFVVLAATVPIAMLASRAAETAADQSIVFGIVMILGSSLALLFPGRAFTGLLAAHLRYDLVSTMQIICVLGRIPLVVLAFTLGGRLLALAGCFAGLQFVEAIGLWWMARRVQPDLSLSPSHVRRGRAREILGYGFHTLVAQIADLMRFKLSPVIVTGFLSAATAGFFDFADKLNRIVGEIAKALMSILSPVFSRQEGRGDSEAMRRSFVFTTKIASYAAMLLGGMMLLYGGAFLQRWVGTRFAYLEPVMQVLVIGTIFAAAQMPTVQFLFGTSRHKTYAHNNVAHGVLVLGLTLLLIEPLGLMGVALGATLPTIAMKFFIIPIPACRALELPLPRFYLKHALLPLLIPLPFLLVYGWLTQGLIRAEYGRIFALACAGSLLYVPYIFALGFDAEERRVLLSALRRRGADGEAKDDPVAESDTPAKEGDSSEGTSEAEVPARQDEERPAAPAR